MQVPGEAYSIEKALNYCLGQPILTPALHPRKNPVSRIFAICLEAILGSTAYAANTAVETIGWPSASVVSSQLTETEWNLKHSSVAGSINRSVQDAALTMLDRARAEIATGNTRTAQELARRAARPLSAMDAEALAGKRPDSAAKDRKVTVAIASIVDGAERIARAKGLPEVRRQLTEYLIVEVEKVGVE
jgi:hypothetical protein